MRVRTPANLWVYLLILAIGGVLGVLAVPVAKSILPSSWVDALRSRPARQNVANSTNTIFHNLSVSVIATPSSEPYGAIEVLGDDLIVADRFGRTWLVNPAGKFVELPFVIPANPAEFAESTDAKQQLADMPGYFEGVARRFGVKDLLLVPRGEGGHDLFASYLYWHAEQGCATVRVSALTILPGRDGGFVASGDWRDVFESRPCVSLGGDGQPIMAEESGGRMILLDEHHVLLTLGDLGHTGIITGPAFSQSDDNTYGKTILIDLNTREFSVYTKGHRNPQGLARAPDGVIYSTEHGPNGGDELNVIVKGNNYGWPIVSYGRTCDDVNACTGDDTLYLRNPLNQHLGSHDGYAKPLFAWLPSIGVSNLIVLRGTQFKNWAGDLLVTSLKARTVFRVHLDEGRAAFVEPVYVSERRIRDIAETNDGTIVLKTDPGSLIFLRVDVSRKEELVAVCRTCHTMLRGESAGLGPNLWSVVARKVAGQEDFAYSNGLRRIDSHWSQESLSEFLLDPQSFAPGTSMKRVMMSKPEADEIAEFLVNLKE
jgi:cytochrome c2